MRRNFLRISAIGGFIFFLTISVNAQFSTNSPYTRFGLGDIAHGGFGQNKAMGGTGLAISDANKLNYMNPAAYSARDSMSVLFDFGLSAFRNQYITSSSENDIIWTNANLDHFALSVPIGNTFAMATGLVPYSSVGYNARQEYDELGTGDAIDLYYKGDGGILKYFLGMSVEFFDRVSLGVNMNYLLGNINRQRALIFPRNRGFAQTTALNEINISHTYPGFGFLYKEIINDKFFFSIGGVYDLETNLKSTFKQTVTNNFSGNASYLDSLYINTEYDITEQEDDGHITIPERLGVGLSLGIPNKLTVTADYYKQDWASVNNSNINAEGFELANSQSFHAGLEYTPDFEAFRGYYNLMSYRVGGYMKDAYVQVDDFQLKDYGMTFGVGLPLGKTKSSMNISFTYGTRGTTDNNLVMENYGILTFNVTLHDLWFYKQKFD
ncbi:MAG TPA: hypothetical protein VJ951_14065 [Bacteroidales bacterium]|nr:hypothetical protein [Bacteroidales bacterium]